MINPLVHWKFFTDAADPATAEKVLKWVVKDLGLETGQPEVQPYQKGGFSFSTVATVPSWPELVVEVLGAAERVGRGWQITGPINESLDVCSHQPSVPGVNFIHALCLREAKA